MPPSACRMRAEGESNRSACAPRDPYPCVASHPRELGLRRAHLEQVVGELVDAPLESLGERDVLARPIRAGEEQLLRRPHRAHRLGVFLEPGIDHDSSPRSASAMRSTAWLRMARPSAWPESVCLSAIPS